ncbi:CpsD/CapB family tyrosine-protein kinase [Tissierella creatinini]|nr:CpsD/CapB family tyrosine-protein kinase [Tissierella creatinini]TJX60537.1 CpsD/CapB family tyrosine-protein kinase [Soehngenia saccharolytica]
MENVKLFTLRNPKSIVSEAFRTLRTNIQFTNIDKSIRTIVITSSGPGEGKTIVVSNLAISIAQTEKRVLLVDCDMRKPRIHKVFGINNREGLTNILMGEKVLADVEYRGEESIKSLTVVTSGPIPPNPSELLGSRRMKDFLEDMRDHFDMIIIDSPPINLVTDSAILSTIADGTIMVVEVGKTEAEAAINGKELLDKVNANLLGVVLNKIPTKERSYYNYGYYHYNEYYGDDEGGRRKKRRKSR